MKDPTAWIDFCSTFHAHAETTQFALMVPKEQKPANISAKLNKGQLVLNGNLTQDVLWRSTREAQEMSKGSPKTNPWQQEIKSNILQPALIRHVQVTGVFHCWWQLFNFYWNPGQTPKSTGCGKNNPHWPEVVKLPLFDTNKNYQFLNIWG